LLDLHPQRELPVHGDYFTDLFPAFLLSGVGLALAFVPMSIGALTGVRPAAAGVASGLINTNQQVGGAIGVALATTIATTVTSHYVQGHPGTTAMTGAALTHGFAVAFYVLAGLAALGAILAAVMLESRPEQPEHSGVELPVVDLQAATNVPRGLSNEVVFTTRSQSRAGMLAVQRTLN
jgi:MFS family permease